MTKDKDSHGSHGGNRGSGESRKDDPNRRDQDADGRATNRNDDRAGDDAGGGNAEMFEDKGR
jgi:hypothetical protein